MDKYLAPKQPQKCPYCRNGWRDVIGGYDPCFTCGGLGRDTNSEFWSEPCRSCQGRGKILKTRERCTSCVNGYIY